MAHLQRQLLLRFFRVFHLLEIEGQEHVPLQGPVIIACNHINYFDPFIIQATVTRRIRFVAWVRGFVGFNGWFMRRMGTIAIDLSKPDRRAYAAVLTVLRDGGVIGIFPEGAFTPDGHVGHPKVGAARMAIETGAVICPSTLTGNFRVWAPQAPGRTGFWGRVIPRPGKMTLKFHPPVVLDPEARAARQHDKAYHRQIIEAVMAPVIRRVEPSLRAEERIEELLRGPASHIRIYEWLPLIATIVGAFFMRLRQVWELRLWFAAATACGLYVLYLLVDIYWIPQHWTTKLVRNILAPVLLLLVMFPTLFDVVARLRLAAWQGESVPAGWWPFSGFVGSLLSDWWTLTYLFPLAYIALSLWVYYFSHYLQFQQLVRGLLLSFYAGLLLIILVPPLGRAYPVAVPPDHWGLVARWFYHSPAASWRFLNFPGFFVLITTYLWLFDRRRRLPRRATWRAPWALNLLMAASFLRAIAWTDALVFALLGWLVIRYLGAVKFLAHDGRWV